MTQLRRPLLALVALFTAAITIDRIGVERGSEAIGSIVYVLAALSVAAPLALASLRNGRPWLPATLAFLTYGTVLAVSGSVGDRDVHVLATELLFLVLAARLGQHLARTIEQLDETLGAIAFGDSTARNIESPESAEVIHDEIARSRRHGRPLALTVLSPAPSGLNAAVERATVEVDRAVRRRYVYGKLARAVGAQLRRSDLLFEHRGSGRLFVLSPETDQDGTTLLVKRVTEAAEMAGVPTEAGTASFPDDAIAFESLVEVAEADLAARTDTTPHLRAVGRVNG